MERRGVDMVRLEQPEEVYDVEEVLGRDAASVFPSMNKELDPMEQLKAAIGAKRFVTETELEQIKAARGLNVDDGTASADKPLAEILAERKKAKQEAFEQQWKDMKTGKNRPLDPDEYDFLDSLAKQEAAQLRTLKQQEDEELAAYRQAVAAAAAAKAAAEANDAAAADEAAVDAAAGPGLGSSTAAVLGRSGSNGATAAAAKVSGKASSKQAVPVIKPILKVKPKAAATAAAVAGQQQAAAGGTAEPGSKRPRLAADKNRQQQQDKQQQQAGPGAGLSGLLGVYGSGSDDDSS